jgi:hypothetical protein
MKNSTIFGMATALGTLMVLATVVHAEETVIYTKDGRAMTVTSSDDAPKEKMTEEERRQAEIEAADDAREIDQEPILGILSPQFRYADIEPGAGDAGDIHYVTNVEEYEKNVANNVYSPTLSTEYVNKLYVDNSIRSIVHDYETQIDILKQDITNVTQILEFVCADMTVVAANGNGNKNGWYKNGKAYEFNSALGDACGGVDWKSDFTPYGHILNAGKDDGKAHAAAGISKTYAAFDGEAEGHADWGSVHNTPNDRAVRFKPKHWSDEDGDGRDDKSYEMYKRGYDIGYK